MHHAVVQLLRQGQYDLTSIHSMYAARYAAFLSVAEDLDNALEDSVGQLCVFDAAASPALRAFFTDAITGGQCPPNSALLYVLLSAAHCDGTCDRRDAVNLARDALLRIRVPHHAAGRDQELQHTTLLHRLQQMTSAVVCDPQGPGSRKLGCSCRMQLCQRLLHRAAIGGHRVEARVHLRNMSVNVAHAVAVRTPGVAGGRLALMIRMTKANPFSAGGKHSSGYAIRSLVSPRGGNHLHVYLSTCGVNLAAAAASVEVTFLVARACDRAVTQAAEAALAWVDGTADLPPARGGKWAVKKAEGVYPAPGIDVSAAELAGLEYHTPADVVDWDPACAVFACVQRV